MTKTDRSEEIWSLLIQTLPENNKDRLVEEGKRTNLPNIPKPAAGQVWTLSCGAQYQWPRNNPFTWMEAKRICAECGHSEFQSDDDVDIDSLKCKKCKTSHINDDTHRGFEDRELEDMWDKCHGKPLNRMPALRISSFKEWPHEEIATTIVARLKPSPGAAEIRKRIQESNDPHYYKLLNSAETAASIQEELIHHSSCCLALRSTSEILFSTHNDRDVFIERLDTDTFAYRMSFTDGAAWTPLLLIDESKS